MEFSEECDLDVTALMVVSSVSLENLVQTLKEERPELSKGTVVAYEITCMCGIMVVRANDLRPIQLENSRFSMSTRTGMQKTNLHELSAVFSDQSVRRRYLFFTHDI